MYFPTITTNCKVRRSLATYSSAAQLLRQALAEYILILLICLLISSQNMYASPLPFYDRALCEDV